MRVLIACEESQAVCKAFRELGHEAYSCDIQECSGGHPEWHILGDATKILNPSKQFIPGDEWYGFKFRTQDGVLHCIDGKWDLIIAHPPCTYLSKAGGNRLRVNGEIQQHRYEKGIAAAKFFMECYNADCPKIAVENPIPLKIFGLPHYSQIVQPYMFGDPWMKTTCLWLRGLPILMATDVVVPTGKWVNSTDHRKIKANDEWQTSGKKSQKERSKTFPGIAKAMAEQWGGDIRNKEEICESD